MAKKKSWREKLEDSKDLPKIEPIPPRLEKSWGVGVFVVPAPIEVDALMRSVKRGRVTTINEIRAALAKRHGADVCCRITAGIFAWIAANAAADDLAQGKTRVTPYWRPLKADGELNPKYPGGIQDVRARLEAEGHRVRVRGKRLFVVDFDKRLAPLK